MRQITQNYRTGTVQIEEVVWPALKQGGVLVRTRYSAVSIGTEGMKVREGRLSYLGKARARPDQLRKVIDTARQQGVVATFRKVMNKLDSLTPLGYSLAGEIVAVGRGAEEFTVGQRVACAGAGYANHAEVNFVPRNLVVPVPENVSLRDAAFATVGAIALQGFRQARLQLGETACVIGLGLLGQLLVQILRAGGVRVLGVDLLEARCRLAERLGAASAMTSQDPRLESAIDRLTGGHGVDGVFIVAGGSDNSATELAVRVARDRGRVVDIGKTTLDLPWNDYYLKELDVRFSRSYGPGRYDPVYEEQGIDYPIGYVRWTERRNLSAFLDLVRDGAVQVEPIISAEYAFDDAERLYQDIASGTRDFLGVALRYGEEEPARLRVRTGRAARAPEKRPGRVRIGVIGAGNYASSMLLPHLAGRDDVTLARVAVTTSLSGQNARRKFGFESVTTDHGEIIGADDIDAVLIATRHSSHARLVAESLRAGKATYVEKPLALGLSELASVVAAAREAGNERLMVGFNRRFAPMIGELTRRFGGSTGPTVGHYRVHAGQLEQGSWYLDPSQGSRFVGEAGHFLDLLSCLIDARPVAVTAAALRPPETTPDDLENLAVVVRYENGSIGNLLYLTQGGAKLPKEYLELFGGGVTMQMHNFESLLYYDRSTRRRLSMRMDKGQRHALEAFVLAVRAGTPMPIPYESLLDTTLATLAAGESLRTGREIPLAGLREELIAGTEKGE